MASKRFSLELSQGLLNKIDEFKREWGLRSRGAIVERLLQELLITEDNEDLFNHDFDEEVNNGKSRRHEQSTPIDTPNKVDLSANFIGAQDEGKHSRASGQPIKESTATRRGQAGMATTQAVEQKNLSGIDISDFNERGALVLVTKGVGGSLALDFAPTSSEANTGLSERSSKGSGIDLPGFVRKQSAQIKRSLTPIQEQSSRHQEPLPTVPVETLKQGLARVTEHWLELYGTPANEAVLEAAMVWLAKDIWPQCDQSEGRLFTWSLACSVTEAFAPAWPPGEANFEKVMVMAGLLEDPFSTSTLQLRLPTLIRRFVHRFRTRKKGTSFQALEHTMTLHGALKLLQLPTAPGHRLTLAAIREAYRDIALTTHPDSGGSEEEMRKVNEAYQLLKELYRNG